MDYIFCARAEAMVDIALNLRFLLWQDEKSRLQNSERLSQWPERPLKWSKRLADWAECNSSRAEDLLRRAEISQTELNNIKLNHPLNDEDFMTLTNGNFLEQKHNSGLNIWQENILFLLDKLIHGENSHLAEHLGISSGNISKWKKRQHEPEKTHKYMIHTFFKLSSKIDLEQYPLFLSIEPVRTQEQKEWLRKKIQDLTEETTQELFPALKRLLENP